MKIKDWKIVLFGILITSTLLYISINTHSQSEIPSNLNREYTLDALSLVEEWTINLYAPINSYKVTDIEGDGEYEILVAFYDYIKCFSMEGEYLWQYYDSDYRMNEPFTADLDNDGEMEIVFYSRKKYSPYNYRIVCLDKHGSLKWFYSSSNYLSNPIIADINNDSRLEIVFAVWYNNLICLNNSGSVLWNVAANTYQLEAILDLDEDGQLDILGYNSWSLFCYNTDGSLKWQYDLRSSGGTRLTVTNVTDDPGLEIVIRDGNEYLSCLDSDGNRIWSKHLFYDSDKHCPLVQDINQDGEKETIILKGDRNIYCYSSSGELNWEYFGSFDPQRYIYWETPILMDINGDNFLEILITDNSNYNQLFCISHLGTLKWERDVDIFDWEMGAIGDFDNDNITELIARLSNDEFLACYEMQDIVNPSKNKDWGTRSTMCGGNQQDTDGDMLGDISERFYNTSTDEKDSDNDTLVDGYEVFLYHTSPNNNDTDSDNLPDWWEIEYCLNPLHNDTFSDPDEDSLTNYDEYLYGTNPLEEDTDGDLLKDNEEIFTYFTDPMNSDSDEDDLSDGDEVLIYGTNPLLNDTDSDLMPDGWEIAYSLDPFVNDSMGDPDNDTIANLEEFNSDINPNSNDTDSDLLNDFDELFVYNCDPTNNDTDSDSLFDGHEIYVYGTSPLNNDTDSDGMPDGWEVEWGTNATYTDNLEDPDADYLINIDEYFNQTQPFNNDTDNDGLLDGEEVHTYGTNPLSTDSDNDTMPDFFEVIYGLDPLIDDRNRDLDNDGINNRLEMIYGTNPSNNDTDSDGMPDGWEHNYNLNPLVNDSYSDYDSDGLVNLDEFLWGLFPTVTDTDFDDLTDGEEVHIYGTNPAYYDTDYDGMSDGWEVIYGLDPLVYDSHLDSDEDDLTNLEEYINDTNPYIADTDGDGMPDGWEVLYSLNPRANDANLDPDGDGITNIQEYNFGINPNSSDTDRDGMSDDYEILHGLDPTVDDSRRDKDRDGRTNIREMYLGTNPSQWDNFLLLFTLILSPVYAGIIYCFILLLRKMKKQSYVRSLGFQNYEDLLRAQEAGFENFESFQAATSAGFTTKDEWKEAKIAGFSTKEEWKTAQAKGFQTPELQDQITDMGYEDLHSYKEELEIVLSQLTTNLNQMVAKKVDFNIDLLDNEKEVRKHLNRFLNLRYKVIIAQNKLLRDYQITCGDFNIDKGKKIEILRSQESVIEVTNIIEKLKEKLKILRKEN